MSGNLILFLLLAWFFGLGGATLYYGAIVAGLYKDPLMARFRIYGEEQRPALICRLLFALAGWSLSAAFASLLITLAAGFEGSFAPLVFVLLAMVAGGAGVLLQRQADLSRALPRWYARVLHDFSRQERQQLARAWFRLPRRLRWRLNGDQAAFQTWVDLVRLTTIYGAYDPSSAWHRWR